MSILRWPGRDMSHAVEPCQVLTQGPTSRIMPVPRPRPDMSILGRPPRNMLILDGTSRDMSAAAARRDMLRICPTTRTGHIPGCTAHAGPDMSHSSPPTQRNMSIPRQPHPTGHAHSCTSTHSPDMLEARLHVPGRTARHGLDMSHGRWPRACGRLRKPSASRSASSSTAPKFTGSCANRPRNRPETPSSVGSSPGLADPP